jgi:hypothetical protein
MRFLSPRQFAASGADCHRGLCKRAPSAAPALDCCMPSRAAIVLKPAALPATDAKESELDMYMNYHRQRDGERNKKMGKRVFLERERERERKR